MPFIPHTPESLVHRSDSKNAATTCKGITIEGNHCKRSIASIKSPLSSKGASKRGLVAVLPPIDYDNDGAAAYFCWQHKDQAESLLVADQNGRKADLFPIQKRSSIDTLAERLGILDVGAIRSAKKGRKRRTKPARKSTLPKKWQDMDGPLLAVSEESLKSSKKTVKPPRPRKSAPNWALSLLCCVRSVDISDSETLPPPRPAQNAEVRSKRTSTSSAVPNHVRTAPRGQATQEGREPIQSPTLPPKAAFPSDMRLTLKSERPAPTNRDPVSPRTQKLLSLIPATLPPKIISSVLNELSSPISPFDSPGYIYMFWLTATAERPDDDTASTLLGDSNQSSSPTACHQRDVIQRHAAIQKYTANGRPATTIYLKIGRTANVQRRMNQWTRQCHFNLSLIRFYPYQPSPTNKRMSMSPTPSADPAKVPHAHKVERLIQLELASRQVVGCCTRCGKKHREWFQIRSTRAEIKAVDEVIRRWIAWDQKASSSCGTT